ncbi:MAG: hypothetical protein K5644_02870 [Lachnospiraceae bacterium]|nr:hypothetical protein [Lachnospiraceae bacterium]
MEKIELTKFLIDKFNERNNEVEYKEGEIGFVVNNVALPNKHDVVSASFSVGGNDVTHVVRFVIKFPVSSKSDFNTFNDAVNRVSSSITTGKYFLEGQGNDAMFCSSYDATFFNTKFEKMNVERTMMFMFDSLLLEYSDILKTI